VYDWNLKEVCVWIRKKTKGVKKYEKEKHG
jgi:hypothetical protein